MAILKLEDESETLDVAFTFLCAQLPLPDGFEAKQPEAKFQVPREAKL